MKLNKQTYSDLSEMLYLRALAQYSEIEYNTFKSWLSRNLNEDGSNFVYSDTNIRYADKTKKGIIRIIEKLAEIAGVNVVITENKNETPTKPERIYKAIVINDPASNEAYKICKGIAKKCHVTYACTTKQIAEEHHFFGSKVAIGNFKKEIKALKNEELFFEVSGAYTDILRNMYKQ